jgi:hypothetical protein
MLRVTPGKPAIITFASSELVMVPTHWLGKPYVCSGCDCPACDVSPVRWRSYAIVLEDTRDGMIPRLMESPYSFFAGVDDSCSDGRRNTAAGLRLEIWRCRANSPLQFDELGWVDPPKGRLATSARLWEAMAVLYHVPQPHPTDTFDSWMTRLQPCFRQLLADALASRN